MQKLKGLYLNITGPYLKIYDIPSFENYIKDTKISKSKIYEDILVKALIPKIQ